MNPVMIKVLGHDLETIDPNVKTYYPFNEGFGAIVKDYSQYANHAILKRDVKWVIGEGGNGLKFNAPLDYIEDTIDGKHIIREGTAGIWSKVIIGNKTKIVGDGTAFRFSHEGSLTGQLVSDFEDYCPNLTNFECLNNVFSGSLPSFATNTELDYFNCSNNIFGGALPSFNTCINLTMFYCNYNAFIGSLPSFSNCTDLETVRIYNNSFSGALPSFAACTQLNYISLHNNSFSGALPSFGACTGLQFFYCYNNSFSNSVPSFGACTALTNFWAGLNSFSGYEVGGFATQASLYKMELHNNAIDDPADINDILADLRTSYDLPGRVACIVKLEGGTNGVPNGQGITDKDFLNAHGWTVTTNEGGD